MFAVCIICCCVYAQHLIIAHVAQASTAVCSASDGAWPQVYLLSYQESLEQAHFQQFAAREKQAFMDLIEKKAHLVLPTDAVCSPRCAPLSSEASAAPGASP